MLQGNTRSISADTDVILDKLEPKNLLISIARQDAGKSQYQPLYLLGMLEYIQHAYAGIERSPSKGTYEYYKG